MPSLPPATQALLLANVAVFFLERLIGGALFGPLALWPIGSGHFFPWQVASYAVLHGSFEHLFFNMLGLWMFGSELEHVWGQKRYVQFYTASVLAAALTQLIVTLNAAPYPTVGASGGLFGLLLAFAMMFPNRTIIPLFPPIPMKAKVFVALYGALELMFGVFDPRSGIAHFAHLGGMAGGYLMIRYWRGQPPFGRR